MRDVGRAEVYSAEHHIAKMMERGGPVDFYGSTIELPPDVRFGQVADMQRYVDSCWPRLSLCSAPSIVESKGYKRAYYRKRTHTIHIPDERWARTRLTLIHEMTHALVGIEHPGAQAHGEEFRRMMPCVMEELGMSAAALVLRANFNQIQIGETA